MLILNGSGRLTRDPGSGGSARAPVGATPRTLAATSATTARRVAEKVPIGTARGYTRASRDTQDQRRPQ
jgi:hypothetical protein